MCESARSQVEHVRRSVLGRAMRLGLSPEAVVHDQQSYSEAMSRALSARRIEWK